ncbi:MAG: Fe(3+) ABC transporter substrate-binding protein [Pseudomonadota bacterium]
MTLHTRTPLGASTLALTLFAAVATASTALPAPAQAAGEVNVYSFRQPKLIQPLLKAFTEQTGIKVNFIFAKKGLIERVKAEGRNTPADVLLTADIATVTQAVAEGIVQPVNSDVLTKRIPASLRAADNNWFGITRRARIVYASKERVKQDKITYEELADPKWRGKICTRSGQHVYNVALFASMVAHMGEEKAKAWLAGLKANLARKPSGNDRAQVKGVYAGECDLAIGNTYYMGKMQTNTKQPEQKAWAKSVKVLFPNAEGRGTHVNISGMALTKHGPNRDNAIKLMEFLTSQAAQKLYASTNFEYPVVAGVDVDPRVKSWGTLKPDPITLDAIAKLRKRASQMVDEINYNAGPSS